MREKKQRRPMAGPDRLSIGAAVIADSVPLGTFAAVFDAFVAVPAAPDTGLRK
jgi:hypothetical protein